MQPTIVIYITTFDLQFIQLSIFMYYMKYNTQLTQVSEKVIEFVTFLRLFSTTYLGLKSEVSSGKKAAWGNKISFLWIETKLK